MMLPAFKSQEKMAKTSTIGSYINGKKKNQEIPELFQLYLIRKPCLNAVYNAFHFFHNLENI